MSTYPVWVLFKSSEKETVWFTGITSNDESWPGQWTPAPGGAFEFLSKADAMRAVILLTPYTPPRPLAGLFPWFRHRAPEPLIKIATRMKKVSTEPGPVI